MLALTSSDIDRIRHENKITKLESENAKLKEQLAAKDAEIAEKDKEIERLKGNIAEVVEAFKDIINCSHTFTYQVGFLEKGVIDFKTFKTVTDNAKTRIQNRVIKTLRLLEKRVCKYCEKEECICY